MRKKAYCPYSNFQVGAALLTIDGKTITGCNIENLAHSPGICAERCAIAKAISMGYREFKACAVVAYQKNHFTSPCGVCRQVLIEFAPNDYPIYITKPEANEVLVSSVHKLLPHFFHNDSNPNL